MTATNKTGVFSLEKVTDRQSNNKWSTILDPYIFNRAPVGTDFGYFMGGSPRTSQVDRLDFENDTNTTVVKGPLTENKNRGGATGNTNYGYHGGGSPAGGQSTTDVDRVDYANDTAAAAPKGPLDGAAYWRQATGNTNFGYWAGSYNQGTKTDRVDYSNDTAVAAPKGPLSADHYAAGATGNSNFGYVGGGAPGDSTVSRIDYSNDTQVAPAKGPLASPRFKICATGDANFGYFMGGQNTNSIIERVDYSNDSAVALVKGQLPNSTDYASTAFSSKTHGYYMGGTPGNSADTFRIDYASDTTAAVQKGSLSSGRGYGTGTSSRINGFPTLSGDPINGTPIDSNGPNTGYSAGAFVPSSVPNGPITGATFVDRIDYANDTATASARGGLPSGFYSWGNTGTSTLDYGYVTSGYSFNSNSPPTGMKTTLMRTDYSNDLASPTLRGGLIQQKYFAAAMGNVDYGYWGGGDPSPRDKLQRFDWSNDSANSVTKTPFSGNRYNMGANGTPSYAYFGGGSTPSNSSMIERLDLSNDDSAVVQKGSLQRTSSSTSGTASPAFGYWTQVSSSASTYIERLDFANDTTDAVYKGPLSAARRYHGMIGSRDYGYIFCGQVNYPSNVVSSTDRLDFNNDTTIASPKGPMSSPKAGQGGTFSSRANALAAPQRIRFIDSAPVPRGYFGGGYNNNSYAPVGPGSGPSRFSTIERYDFDNDTNTGSQVASLINNGVYQLGSISSPAFSYFIGGSGVGPNTSTGPYMTTIQRLDLTNETFTTRGNTSGAWYRINVTGNANYGYISGVDRNTPWPYGSKIERIDFSNDNGAGIAPGSISNFSAAQGGPRAAVSSSNYGYYGGGHISPAPLSTVERLDFGNDTSNLVTKGPLSIARQGLAAVASPAYGYFGGGVANPGGTYYSTIDRIDFANDTAIASPKSILTVIKKEFAGVSNVSYGYFGGGYNIVPGGNNYLSSTDRLDFANDTSNTVSKGALSSPRNNLTGTSAILAAPPAPVEPPFPSPTQAAAPGPSMGYTLGGSMPYSYSTVDRKDYSNDTVAALVRGPLTAGTSYHAGVSNKDYGYSLGGKTPTDGKSTKVDRVDYANDTVVAAAKGPLSAGYYRSYAGVGNKEYGYVIGGNYPSAPWSSITQRIEYANDTAQASPKGQLQEAVYLNAGAGNLSYGYTAGGQSPSYGSSNYSKVERLDYSNDTANAVVKGPLAQGARKLTATGTASYGYWGGGTSPDISIIQRLDYSSDTDIALTKGPLSINRDSLSSFSSPAYGYFNGGNYPNISLVERMDYSNDTADASTKGPLSGPRGYMPGVSAQDIGGALN